MKSIRIFRFVLLFIISLSSFSLFSQQSLTILCVAAHPDDEDGATLAYYSKLKEYKALTIFYTRGEGGQNEIGPELYDELGKIREKECMDAAKIQGSIPLFLGFLDFGFSKTAKETFRMWGGKDSVLERIVYLIREIRPDVIITNHDTITTKPNRQHGNHQAVGITIYEAFEKAADPNYLPELFANGITPWQVKKLYFRVYDTTKTTGIVSIDIYQKDATGKTIGDIAIEGLSQHKTQGMDKIDWKNIPEVSRQRRYELVRSDKDYPFDPADLFSGVKPEPRPYLAQNEQLPPPQSYPTEYHYFKINPEDSLRILKNLSFNENAYIGLVNTYDNTIESTLKALKIKYDILDSNLFSKEDLGKYSVIILDLRTYLYRTDVASHNDRLIDYVTHGGNVVCFYNKPSDWNGKNYSPYPIYLTSERVTEEDAKVTVLIPEHDFFNKYNKIGIKDWDGWVQERNIYLPSDDTLKTSNKYHKLLAMNDEDDPVPSTSLLVADPFGLGSYTYCSLALYRQLRIFNEGSLKLFLNMISQHRRFIER